MEAPARRRVGSGLILFEAVDDTPKAIAASLLMEQVLALRFDYGEDSYDPNKAQSARS